MYYEKKGTCEVCGKHGQVQFHHRFPQTKVNKKLYPEYIHDKKNIVIICEPCHLWKEIPRWSEKEFCQALGIEPKSKSSVMRAMRVSQK